MSEINLNVNAEGGELVVRIGTAPEIKDPVPVRFNGQIDAPAEFLNSRGGWDSGYFEPLSTMVVVGLSNKSISLIRQDRNAFKDIVTGCLSETHWINALRINHDTGWAPLDLAKFIRRAGIMSPDDSAKFVSILQAVTMKAKSEIELKNDSRGNITNKLAKELETNLPRDVRFNFPLFKGDEKETVYCDIFIEDKNGPTIFLEIPSLEALVEDRALERIVKQVERILEIAPGITLLYE